MLHNARVYSHIEHAIGGPLADELIAFEILDQAAAWLSAAHPWRFLSPTTAKLQLRQSIDVTAGTYTDATKTINSTNAFTNYAWASDFIDITAATSATLKEYPVRSRSDASNIVLVDALGADDTVTGKIKTGKVILPSDFQGLIAISPTNSLTNGLAMTTMADIVRLRTSEVDVASNWNYVGAINTYVHHGLGVNHNTAAYVLEVWPTPVTTVEDAFTMVYRRRIVVENDDAGTVQLPLGFAHLELLLIRAARIFALGYEEGDESDSPSMDLRLAELVNGPLWYAAIRQDGLVQPMIGRLMGGAVRRYRQYGKRLLANQVDAPA